MKATEPYILVLFIVLRKVVLENFLVPLQLTHISLSLSLDQPPPKRDKSSAGSMGRTIGIAVGCAAAYIVLVVGLMIYCKGRRAKQSKKEEIIPPECENRKWFFVSSFVFLTVSKILFFVYSY